jgi:ATP-dependent protease HslVU (ClpYQ) peptidase subunit
VTCVAGIAERGAVYLGGDAIAVAGYSMHTRDLPKVFTLGPFVIGCANSFRAADVVRYKFAPPTPQPKDDLHCYMATTFVDALRETYKAHGVAVIENSAEEVPCEMLVGVRGTLFTVEDDFQVGVPRGGIAAVGCGGDVALGALYALGKRGTPKSRLTTALHAAEAFCAGVRAPFSYVTLRRPR